jgi:sterol desaturase/sphingolipid hydroxylase (fatty acid hydroxylase superfamily)
MKQPLPRIPQHLMPQKGEIRLFSNPLLERLSRISPWTVLAVYVPMVAFSIWKSFTVGISSGLFGILFVSGIAFWTLFEYSLYRYVFHFFPEGPFQERVQFLFHGIHHQYPNDKDRLVMPVTLSLLITLVLFFVFSAVFGQFVWGFFAGVVLGYLAYDMTHYSVHHAKTPKNAYLAKLWKHHLDHHYRDTNKSYGVSSAAWDHVFGSMQVNKNNNERK